jgi:ubiquinone/menaquinone biosynthesis C-methylase UbiE
MTPPHATIDTDTGVRRDLDLCVLDAAKIQAWERLLFVQCGDGWIVEEAWRRAMRAYACGLDMSPELVARATELRGVPGRLEFTTWDGSSLPCSDHSFHRVFSTFALARSTGLTSVLAEMRRVLHPEGEIYLLELDRRADGVASPAIPAFAAALQRAGFGDTEELVRREVCLDWSGQATGVIIRARHAAPRGPALPAA